MYLESYGQFKNYMNKYLALKNINDWPNNTNFINDIYNALPHRSLNNYSPNEVFNNDARYNAHGTVGADNIINQLNINNENIINIKYYEVGDIVRLRNKKTLFEKEGEIYSRELYTIVDKDKNKYTLQNLNNNAPGRASGGNILNKTYNYNQLLKSNIIDFNIKKNNILEHKNKLKNKLKFNREGLDKKNIINNRTRHKNN